MSATPALATLVTRALAEADNDIAEAVRQVKKQLAADAALATEVLDALIEGEVKREAQKAVRAAARSNQPTTAREERRAAERVKGLALMAERACLDYRLELACGGLRLAAADADDLAREIKALDASLAPVIELRRWLMTVRARLAKPGARVEHVFTEEGLQKLREEARVR